jgi:hypothetical protein
MRGSAGWAALIFGAAVTIPFMSMDAHACGESLFRVGKGVTYRSQTAPLPGNVLMVARSDGAKARAEGLAAAGHHVTVVGDVTLVAQELRTRVYDIVLAPFSDRATIEAEVASAAASATYLPVTLQTSERVIAARTYERFLSADDDVTQFLRVIHHTLKEARRD